MARIPDKTAPGSPTFARRPQANFGRGGAGAAVGQGLARLGASLTAIGEARKEEENALDLIKADAKYKTEMYQTQREFSDDPEYKTFEPRFRGRASSITQDAASIIRDPKLREKWSLRTGVENESNLNSVLNRGQNLERQDKFVEVEEALKHHQRIYTDPATDEITRRQARADIEAAITLGEQKGLLEPKVAANLREGYSRGSVIEDANTRLLTDPEGLRNDLTGAGVDAKPQDDAIGRAAQETGVPDHLLRTFAQIESSGNPKARTGSYKGLYQLSDSEFEKYGGGDIYNADDNARAAAKKISAEAAEFERKYGREPSATDLYLIHQQGKGGYEAHVSNPELPAWMNMHSTGEGRQKGEAWAKQAIWGNIPDDVKEQFGSVEDVTSADFIKLWDRKIHRIGGTAGDVSPRYAELTPLERAEFTAKARKQEGSMLEGRREELKRALKDDEESIRRTGVSTNPDLQMAQKVLEPNQINRYVLNRRKAKMEFEAINDLPQLTEAEIVDRLAAVEPSPGEEDYDAKADVYDKALKKANTLRDQREKDPALSVAELADVQVAEQGVRENPGDPEFVQALAAARIDAQAKVGIPEGLQSPITKQESRVLLSPTRGLEGDALYKSLEEVQGKLEEQYGPYARVAAAKAFEYDGRSKETAEELAGFVDGLFKGEKISASQIRRLEFLNETDLATRAFGGDFVGDPVRQYQGRPVGEDQGAPMSAGEAGPAITGGMRKPPQGAIDLLAGNPALAPQFNSKYGPGAAEKVFLELGITQ